MGQARRESARLVELVRTTGEPRWAAVVDGLLATIVVVWMLVLSSFDPDHTLRLAVPLVLAAGVVWRVFVLVESSQRSRTLEVAHAPQPEIDTASTGPAQAA